MDPENKKDQPPKDDNEAEKEVAADAAKSAAPADALSMTPEELGNAKASDDQTGANVEVTGKAKKGPGGLKRILKKVNLYLMAFIILLVIAGVVTTLTWLYSQKKPPEATIGSQNLSQEALKDLASGDASVGDARQRLTIKGDTTIEGQTLLRSNLDVAGNIQTSGKISGADLTISGTSNLANMQANRLQVSGNADVTGDITLGGGLNVTGTSTFNGPMTASKITAAQLVMSGNAKLEIPGHLAFTGPTPGQNVNNAVLGNGGSASLSGSDTSGTIAFNSGNSPTAGCFITVNFRSNFQATPHVVISPVDAAAGNLNYYVTRTTTSFTICSNNAPAGNSRFGFDYFVAG